MSNVIGSTKQTLEHSYTVSAGLLNNRQQVEVMYELYHLMQHIV